MTIDGFDPKAVYIAGRPFVVPAYALSPDDLPQDLQDDSPYRCTVNVDGIIIDAFLLPVSTSTRDMETRGGEYVFETGIMDDKIVPVRFPPAHAYEMVLSNTGEPDEALKKELVGADAYDAQFMRLSRLTGWKIHLHVNVHFDLCVPPYPKRDGIIHIVPNAAPPGGMTNARWVREMFGYALDKGQHWMHGQYPAEGRGLVLKEGDVPAVQILGNTVYVLFPILSVYHGVESRVIMNRLLALVVKGFRDREHKVVCPVRRRGKDAFVGLLTNDRAQIVEEWQHTLEGKRRGVVDLQRELAVAQRDLLEYAACCRALCKSDFYTCPSEAFEREYDVLASHPDVEAVYVYEKGIHVRTKMIVAEYEGRRYAIGVFTVRFDPSSGLLSIWSVRSMHPKGIPHPHISISGSACFGTASDALMRLSGQFKYGECFEMLVRWLKEGYMPSAETKIEEWPIAEVNHD